jgi:hypothetical protein
MLGLRGVSQTLAIPLSKGAEAAITGIAGIGHLLLGSGILLLFLCLRKLKTLPGKQLKSPAAIRAPRMSRRMD